MHEQPTCSVGFGMRPAAPANHRAHTSSWNIGPRARNSSAMRGVFRSRLQALLRWGRSEKALVLSGAPHRSADLLLRDLRAVKAT